MSDRLKQVFEKHHSKINTWDSIRHKVESKYQELMTFDQFGGAVKELMPNIVEINTQAMMLHDKFMEMPTVNFSPVDFAMGADWANSHILGTDKKEKGNANT